MVENTKPWTKRFTPTTIHTLVSSQSFMLFLSSLSSLGGWVLMPSRLDRILLLSARATLIPGRFFCVSDSSSSDSSLEMVACTCLDSKNMLTTPLHTCGTRHKQSAYL